MVWLLFAFAVVLFLFMLGLVQAQRSNRAWRAVASRHGFEYTPAGLLSQPVMRGRVEGVWVQVDVHSTNFTGFGQRTRYFAQHRPVGPPVTLRRQHAASGLAGAIGRNDVEIGDPFFDRSVVVDSRHDDEITRFLTPARRAAVLAVHESWRRWSFTRESLTFERRGVQRNAEVLGGAVRFAVDIALVMGDPAVLNTVLELREQGRLAASARELAALNDARHNAFTELIEAENRMSLGEHGAAEHLLHELEARWTGKVTSRERYRTDRDFGPGPGVRAMLLLGSVGGSDLISSQVHAAVALPAGTEINVGDQIHVEGLLTHADRFSRNLWIEQARLA